MVDEKQLEPHTAGIRLQSLQILLHGHGKGMMHGHKALFLIAPLKLRKLRHPKEIEFIRIYQIQLFRHFYT